MVRIHELLTAGKYPNCSKLAREFEVSGKTIQRDIEFMRDQLALPIEYDGPKHGFFYAHAVAQFPMITVSEGELVALLVAQKAVEQYRGTSFEKPLHAAFEKLVASLGNEASVSLHELSEAVSFRSAGVPRSQIEVFELLADAVMTSRTVEFDYLSLRAKTRERRRVDPYHLACISSQWYLIAKDQARNSLRTFALTRVENATNTGLAFERPADFSAAKMLAGSFAAFEAGKTETIRIHFDDFAARLVAERQWHKSQKLQPRPDGGADLVMQVGVAPDLEAWILGWGGHAEVLEPETLREKIALAAQEMARRYLEGTGPSVRENGTQGPALEGTGPSVPEKSEAQDATPKGTRSEYPASLWKNGTQGPASLQAHGAQEPASLQAVAPKPGRRHPAHHPPRERHNQAVIFLVTVCTKNRKPLLANTEAHELLLTAWRHATSWHVGRYVIMPDHLHLFCSPAETPARSVKQWVRFWKAEVSRHWPRPGEQPVWQVDFWDRQLREDEHYAGRWEYVRNNPVRAGLAATADEWPWQGEIHELRL